MASHPVMIYVPGGGRNAVGKTLVSRARMCKTLMAWRCERRLRENLERRLEQSERQLAETQALAGIGNWEFDLINDQIRWSDETLRIFGIEAVGQEPDFADVLLSIHPEDAPMFDRAIQRAVIAGESYRLDLRIRCPNGQLKHIHAQGSPVRDETQEVVRIIGTVLDITERKYAEQKLLHEATYDALTGLVTRRPLYAKLDSAIEAARAANAPLAVCVSDVDKFKRVNDTYGHAAGDEILVAFAQILQDGTRASDIAGRLGGDEFCVLFPQTTAARALICLDRVRVRLEATVFCAADSQYSVTATFGVAEWRKGMSAKELLEAADQALYRAKEQGRNCVVAGVSSGER